jgi:hypothetical protein
LLFISATVVLALIGIASMQFATRWGAGISPDSVGYIDSARNLLDGRGYVIALFHPLVRNES